MRWAFWRQRKVWVSVADLTAVLSAASEPLDWPQPYYPVDAHERLWRALGRSDDE